jgi:FtsP/CotA-like multicopper oxidase with cupredoxin domain
MGFVTRWLLIALVGGVSVAQLAAQCPDRPAKGSVVQDPLAIKAQNGVLQASLALGHSVDADGFTHYCFQYQSPDGVVEAPTLRLHPGNQLQLSVSNVIQGVGVSKISNYSKLNMKMNMKEMDHAPAAAPVCGDGGAMTESSTNVHFHGLPIPPTCHQDDVIDTLIQPGSAPFDYSISIPKDTPPGLYWYHPHVHGFTEYQVNGGAAGAIVIEGMDKVRPEVKGLKERVFVIRQQYLVPWIPGPYKLSINYQVSDFPHGGPAPVINMKPGERQFWRVVNATLQDFLPLEVWINGVPEQLEVVALDGYPLPQTRKMQTILIPPAGRAEFIVEGPPSGGYGQFLTDSYSTGPTGNPDLSQVLAVIQLKGADAQADKVEAPEKDLTLPAEKMRWSDLASKQVTTERKLFFSEEFGGSNGPAHFYITVEGQKQKVFEADEKPAITTHVGAIEEWTIENHALETHAFHMHQLHFQVMEVDGKPVPNQDLVDTVAIPFWSGKGPYHSVKVRMDFSDPNIVGTFLFHCHILLHEDLGMMHKILVLP